MFSSHIPSWRIPTQVLRIKGENVSSFDKNRFYEDAIDYIISFEGSTQELINEILGFSNTKCVAFYKLSIDNSFFFYDDITKEITYLLIIAYIKNEYLIQNIDNIALNHESIKLRLAEYLNVEIISKLNESYLNRVRIVDNKIVTTGNYKSVNLQKLDIMQELNQVRWTNKPNNFCEDLYHNHNGMCLGATNHWLYCMLDAYKYSAQRRDLIKNNYIHGLAINSINVSNRVLKSLKDKKTSERISHLQRNINIGSEFRHIQNIYSTNMTIANDIILIYELMKENCLTKLFAQIITDDHVMGMVFVTKGNLMKIMCYDPISDKTYTTMNANVLDPQPNSYMNMFMNMPYFIIEQNNCFALTIRCYTDDLSKRDLLPVSNNFRISNITNLSQLLQLSISSNDEYLILEAIKHGAYAPNALIKAIKGGGNLHIITILINSNIIDVDYIDETGCTALYYATLYNKIEVVDMLLDAGAQVSVSDNAKSPLSIALNCTKNMTIYSKLKKHTQSI